MIRDSLPALEKLRRFGHTVALGVLWRDNVTYLFHAPPGTPAAQAVGRIGLYPATSGGIGMALLATLEDPYIDELYADASIPGFPGGLIDLRRAITVTRELGYASVEVHEGGDHRTIAIAVGDNAYSAIGVSGWIPAQGVAAIVQELRETALAIESGVDRVDQPPLNDMSRPV